MKYSDFVSSLKKRMEDQLGEEYVIRFVQVPKNNGQIWDSFTVARKDVNISAAVFLNDFYQEYCSGTPFQDVVQRFGKVCRMFCRESSIDASFFTDPVFVRKHVFPKLVNAARNRELLTKLPHRLFLNLAVIYYIRYDDGWMRECSVLANRDYLRIWNMTEDEIHQKAFENLEQMDPWECMPMGEMMDDLLCSEGSGPVPEEETADLGAAGRELYVLTGKKRLNGSIWITRPGVLKAVGERMGTDYYVLPSSVHECILMPYKSLPDSYELACFVREVNNTQVPAEDILADAVYLYDRKEEQLVLLQDLEEETEGV